MKGTVDGGGAILHIYIYLLLLLLLFSWHVFRYSVQLILRTIDPAPQNFFIDHQNK